MSLETSERLYQILGLADFSSTDAVRAAYKQMALRYHPDKNLDDPTAIERFREVRVAYDVLGNDEKKKKYDAQIRLATTLGRRTNGNGSGNPYLNGQSTSTNINTSIYEEMRRYHSQRTASSAPPGAAAAAGKQEKSQYTKAQQEAFKKKERERQNELKRQREQERKDQREREREALRKEQERQEELLQRQWQQQQQRQFSSARSRTPRARQPDGSTPRPMEPMGRSPSMHNSGSSPEVRLGASSPSTLRRATPSKRPLGTPRATGTPRMGSPIPSSVPGRRTPPPNDADKDGGDYFEGSRYRDSPQPPPGLGPQMSAASHTSASTGAAHEEYDIPMMRYAPMPSSSTYSTSNANQHKAIRRGAAESPGRSPARGTTAQRSRSQGPKAASTPRGGSTGRSKYTTYIKPPTTIVSSPTPSPARTPNLGLSSADRDALEKRRLEKLEKEKDRQREARMAEEEKHFQQLKRIRRQQERQRREREEEEAALETPEERLRMLELDETCERQQLIEKEEVLAWRRIQRSLSVDVDSVLQSRVLQKLVAEEEASRAYYEWLHDSHRDVLNCYFAERLDRLCICAAEMHDRKKIGGKLANEAYYVRRRSSRTQMVREEEQLRRTMLKADERFAATILFRLVLPEGHGRARTAQMEADARERLWQRYRIVQQNMVQQQQQQQQQQQHTAPAQAPATVATSPLVPRADGGGSAAAECAEDEQEERAVLGLEEEKAFLSFLRQRSATLHGCYIAEREAAVRKATEEMQDELRSLREELRKVRRSSGPATSSTVPSPPAGTAGSGRSSTVNTSRPNSGNQ